MSSTNKTTYYELPQFVDNDIFNPLVDDNDAYSKIDTALHNIANAEADDASDIVGIKSRLDSAEGNIDALEAQNGNNVLTTTAQTLSGAVNELDADTSALDSRLDIVEDDINNVTTGLKAKVEALETETEALNSKKVGHYDVVASMIADTTLTEGMEVTVDGYYTVNDYGAGKYLIVSSGNYQLNLANGLHARLIHDGTVNIAQLGAKYQDGVATKSAFDKILASQIKHVLIPPYEYEITGTVEITYPISIEGMHPTYSKLVETDKTLDLFVVGTVDSSVNVRFSNLSLWNNPDTTSIPNKASGDGTSATNKCINLVNAKNSIIDNVKINRFEYAIFIANGNFSIDIVGCKLHADDNGVYLDGANQAINIVLCDFDYNCIGVRVDSGIGALVVDKCQIENCYVGIRKRNSGDITVSNCYFDANGRRSIELSTGNLRNIIVQNNVFLENSLNAVMIDATGITSGNVFLIGNSVSSVNSTAFISGTAPIKYDINNIYAGSAFFITNITNIVKPIYDNMFLEHSTYGELAGSATNGGIIKLKKAHLQRIYNDLASAYDFTIDFSDVNDLPNSSQIVCVVKMYAGSTITFANANANRSTYTNSTGANACFTFTMVKVANSGTWEIWVQKNE